nr:retrovirus-related Pol polyprotein from transposon TNT 1-94 [Tanacetum cinerariifolium]
FIEGLGHNLFSVGQFCDSDLEVAFRRNACFVRNLKGVDLLKGDLSTNLYTINLHEMTSASPICLTAHASSTKLWLWHQRLSHLNFDTINDLARNDLVAGLLKFKYHKEHLCPSCEQGYDLVAGLLKFKYHKEHLLHMDLCGPMRIASINGKRYILVIVDDYSRYTWVNFFRSKDEAPAVIITFLKRITVLFQKPDISFLHVFGALCYPKNDREDIGKLGAKGDIGFFIGYSADSCAYRIYNRRTKKIMETMNVSFDELSAMAFEQRSSKPGLQCELDLLFKAMYDDYFGGQLSANVENVSPAQEPQVRQTSTASTTIADNVPIPTNSSSHAKNIQISSQDVDELNPNAMIDGKLVAPSGDNACTSNTMEPKIKRFPNSTSLLGRLSIFVYGASTQDTSKNTKFAKQPIAEILPKIGETNALSKPVTFNSVSTPPISKGVNNAKVIAPGMFRICPDKVSREEKKVPNTVSASSKTKLITVSQPSVITKKDMNSNLNGLSSTGLDNTKTRRPQPRSNTKNDRVPSASKSSQSKNKEVKVEDHHRNLLLSKKNKHILSAYNNSKIDSQDVISKVVCAKCKKCLNSVNHDVCLNSYVNGKNSRGRKHKANVSKNETKQKNQPEIKKPKKVGFVKRLATPKPRKPRFLLRWSPTGKMFDQDGKLVSPSNSESHVDCSNGDNACTSNAMEPKIKRFPNSTSLLGRNDHVAAILGFGDLQWGNILITRVYFVEGFGHTLFSVGQFCDSDLEVAFRRNACFVRNLEG